MKHYLVLLFALPGFALRCDAYDCMNSNEYKQFLARSAEATSKQIALSDQVVEVLIKQGMSYGSALDERSLAPRTPEQARLHQEVMDLLNKAARSNATTAQECSERIQIESLADETLVRYAELRLLMFRNRTSKAEQ